MPKIGANLLNPSLVTVSARFAPRKFVLLHLAFHQLKLKIKALARQDSPAQDSLATSELL